MDLQQWITSGQPPLSGEEVVQTTVYTENTNAMNGHTVYVKEFSVDTGNKVARTEQC